MFYREYLTSNLYPMKNIKSFVGERIKRARVSMNISQMELAERVGISYQQIQKYEKGLSEISVTKLYQIAEALGMNAYDLLPPSDIRIAERRSRYGGTLSRDENMLIELFRQVKKEEIRKGLLMIIKGVADIERKTR
uniref:DNA binding protein n=1 Tax=uncultured prokaryote TaxID=198431 RepID=H5SEL8_9ZZZZ|nr:DNA binding protein [uncultured prokaryote]